MADQAKRFLRPERKFSATGVRLCSHPECRNPLPKGRMDWCSERCVADFNIRGNPTTQRLAVERRDHGVCAVCGLDTKVIAAKVQALNVKFWQNQADPEECRSIYQEAVELLEAHGLEKRLRPFDGYRIKILPLWEADHIDAVSEGGAFTGLDNLRTLCRACHLKVTRELRLRLATKGTP